MNTSVKALVQNTVLAINCAFVSRRKSRRGKLANEEKFYDSFFEAAELYEKWDICHQFKLRRRQHASRGRLPAVDFVIHDLRMGVQSDNNNVVTFDGGTINAFEIAIPQVRFNGNIPAIESLEKTMDGDDDKLTCFQTMLDRSKGLKSLLPRTMLRRGIKTVKFQNVTIHPFWVFTGQTRDIYQAARICANKTKRTDYKAVSEGICQHLSDLHSSFHPAPFDGVSIWGVHAGVPKYDSDTHSILPGLKKDEVLKKLPSKNCFSTIVAGKDPSDLHDLSFSLPDAR